MGLANSRPRAGSDLGNAIESWANLVEEEEEEEGKRKKTKRKKRRGTEKRRGE